MPHLSSTWFSCALFVAALALPHPAGAEEQPPSSSTGANAGPKTVEVVVRRARQARWAGRFADAQAVLEAALSSDDAAGWTAAQRARLVGELGIAELGLGNYRDAAEHVQQSFDHWTDLPESFHPELQDAFNGAVKHVGRIYCSLSPPDAAVLLDGRPIGRAAKTYLFFVNPGTHTIRARLSGYNDVTQTFDVYEGQSSQITMALPEAPEPVVAAATVKLPPAATRVKLPPAATHPAPKPSIPDPPAWWPWLPLRIGGGVLTVGAVVAGGVFLGEASTTGEELDARASRRRGIHLETDRCSKPPIPADCSELADLRRRQDTFTKAGWVSLSAGGAIGALTIASFFFVRDRPATSGLNVTPMVASHQTGVLLQGSW